MRRGALPPASRARRPSDLAPHPAPRSPSTPTDSYVSAGLDAPSAAYNLALDDGGVRGCPAYEDVAQPSMAGFDVAKYQGRWLELGFHDWTQFTEVRRGRRCRAGGQSRRQGTHTRIQPNPCNPNPHAHRTSRLLTLTLPITKPNITLTLPLRQVYGTTLDIALSDDGERWLDDFAVKAPAPLAAPRSWDKSPVANGAHYFLYGKVDRARPGVLQVRRAHPPRPRGARPPERRPSTPRAPPLRRLPPPPISPLQESGFGLTFPNFIVDVQTDPKTGAYTQALQFQCLERGGVRIFEGINFLSRTPDDAAGSQMAALHARATKAGLDPYGATAAQTHVVTHPPPGGGADNAWQRMWEAVGLPRLLALAEGAMHTQAEGILNKVN